MGSSRHGCRTVYRNFGYVEHKKAIGRITFSCNEGHLIDKAIAKAIETREGQTIWLKSIGINTDGIEVSSFNFEWTIKVKT